MIYVDPNEGNRQSQQLLMTLLSKLALARMEQSWREKELAVQQKTREEAGRTELQLQGYRPAESDDGNAISAYGQKWAAPAPVFEKVPDQPGYFLFRQGDKSQLIQSPRKYNITLPGVGEVEASGESLVNMHSHLEGIKQNNATRLQLQDLKESMAGQKAGTITMQYPNLGEFTTTPQGHESMRRLMGFQQPMDQGEWTSKAQTEMGRQFGKLTSSGGYTIDEDKMRQYQRATTHLEPLRAIGLDPMRATDAARRLAEAEQSYPTEDEPESGGRIRKRILGRIPRGSIFMGQRKDGAKVFMTQDYRLLDQDGNQVSW